MKHLKNALQYVRKNVIYELTAQGHVASGDILDIDIQIERTKSTYSGHLIMQDYADDLDTGGYKMGDFVTMLKWAKQVQPNWTESEQNNLAVHTANRTAYLKGSWDWSNNGRRLHWMKYAIENKERLLEKKLKLGSSIDDLIHDFCKNK